TAGDYCNGADAFSESCIPGEYLSCANGGSCNGSACDCPEPFAGPTCEDCIEGYIYFSGDGGYCELDSDGDGYVNWDDNCPEIPNPDQTDSDYDGAGDECDCAPLNDSCYPGGEGDWCDGKDNDCDGKVDEFMGEGPCDGPTIDYNGHTYLFLFSSGYYYDNLCPWGYRPVVINGPAENTWIYETMTDFWGEEPPPYWIGLHYDMDRAAWRWDAIDQPAYRKWASGQPYQEDGEECVEVRADGNGAPVWYATSCWNNDLWVCEACGNDSDGDGYGDLCDCAPTDPAISPDADELLGNGIDDNCNGIIDEQGQGGDIY
ncbi:MAG TPA: MopE-related protein, partial [bacterium]|nr:MopE-related protein [bacterium]